MGQAGVRRADIALPHVRRSGSNQRRLDSDWMSTTRHRHLMNIQQSPQSQIDIRRSHQRFHTQISWLDSRHSFSFSDHYDPANTHHGLLLVNNDDVVDPGTGFETHPHRDMEIVTWVLRGSLVHQDSTGHSGLIYPGL